MENLIPDRLLVAGPLSPLYPDIPFPAAVVMTPFDTFRVLIGDEATGRRLGLTPRARIVTSVALGSEPTAMLTGPAPAARKALQRAGLQVQDIGLWEVNEAFASVVLRFVDELALDMDRVNVNGGAIGMGHPMGATGAMILGTLLDEMEARGQRFGLAALCVAAGMGSAAIIERL